MSQNALARRYYARGRAEFSRGDAESACESFRAASDLAPSFVSARLGYAAALAKVGDPPRAANVLRAGIGRVPPTASARVRAALWRCLGDVLVAGGDYLGALEAYREAGTIDPTDRGVDDGMGRVCAKLGRWSEALSHMAKAAGTAPAPPAAAPASGSP